MTELKVKTKGNASPERKPRVYFTCHPADLERSVERICEDIFAAADCAVYYTPDMADCLPAETRETDMERMNLFVIPVSLKLLLEPNRAMDEDFPFAKGKHIPVLPILLEPGLDPIYGREDKFGPLQYLDLNQNDPTAIPYSEKLKKYLDSVLVDSETVKRIQAAFDAYIFLSYRKKDRKQANELMRIIHADPQCRDLAIWFDEFLIPGESFTDTIQEAMKRSRAFALLVTPSLLEPNDKGEPNYVQSTEYPKARELAKEKAEEQAKEMDILPAELPSENGKPTDREALFRDYTELPEPLNVRREEERERFLERLRRLASAKNNDDPAHNYLIGLAYLDGIDVEVNRERGLALITAAGEAELWEAMEKLYAIYEEGIGVFPDYSIAAYWAEKLEHYCRREFGAEHPYTLTALNNLADTYGELGEYQKAMKLLKDVYSLRCKILGESHPDTLNSLNDLAVSFRYEGDYRNALDLLEKAYALLCKTLGEDDPRTITSLHNLACVYGDLGDYQKAQKLQNKAYTLRCRVRGKDHQDTLISMYSLAIIHAKQGEFCKALVLIENVYDIQCRLQGENNPNTLSSLHFLASIYSELGEPQKGLELLNKCFTMQCMILGEAHPRTLETLNNIAMIYAEQGDYQQALELEEKVCSLLLCALGEEHPNTLAALENLAGIYEELGNYQMALEKSEIVYTSRSKTLGENHPDTLSSLSSLASIYSELGEQQKSHEIKHKINPCGV